MEFLFTVLAWAVFSVAGFFFLQANPRLKERVRDKLHIFLLFTLLVVIFVRLIFF